MSLLRACEAEYRRQADAFEAMGDRLTADADLVAAAIACGQADKYSEIADRIAALDKSGSTV